MDFEWDPEKDASTRRTRGFDFAFAIQVFLDPDRLDAVDARRDYGETRRRTLGCIEGDIYVVVYTIRGERLRVISARRARRDEKRTYRTR